MDSPCVNCLVNTMCKKPCEDFYSYLYRIFGKRRQYSELGLQFLARKIREGKAELLENNDVGWRWLRD